MISIGLLFLLLTARATTSLQTASSCSLTDDDKVDPALKEMTFDVGDGPQTTMVYVEPDVASFYKLQEKPPASNKVTPMFNGFQGKFINLSAKTLSLYWEDGKGGAMHMMRRHKPFTASGTATFPTHRFWFTQDGKPDKRLHLMEVQEYPENIYYYDPYHVPDDPVQTEKNLKALNKNEREKYNDWRKTIIFNDYYRNFTGRSYLSNYLRDPPIHHLWRADYFGQEHWVTTQETQFTEMPPSEELEPLLGRNSKRRAEGQPTTLAQYREPGIMNMTLRALSCAPRVFEIPNFLSDTEIQHILSIAGAIDLKLSSTGDGDGAGREEDNRRTRTSFNSWVPREKSPILDAIYRRAADLQRVDEALMRHRDKDEWPEIKSRRPLTEALQLVHYEGGQEYTAHHDFGFSRIEEKLQPARFSTLLLYLNDDVIGGETTFPRWVNAETFHKLEVKPEAGKAVLFYSQLPDGNMDDFSHHAAEPVRVGEKWLINLWMWDPMYE